MTGTLRDSHSHGSVPIAGENTLNTGQVGRIVNNVFVAIDEDEVEQIPTPPSISIQKFQGTGSSSINNQQTLSSPMIIQATDELRYRLRVFNT